MADGQFPGCFAAESRAPDQAQRSLAWRRIRGTSCCGGRWAEPTIEPGNGARLSRRSTRPSSFTPKEAASTPGCCWRWSTAKWATVNRLGAGTTRRPPISPRLKDSKRECNLMAEATQLLGHVQLAGTLIRLLFKKCACIPPSWHRLATAGRRRRRPEYRHPNTDTHTPDGSAARMVLILLKGRSGRLPSLSEAEPSPSVPVRAERTGPGHARTRGYGQSARPTGERLASPVNGVSSRNYFTGNDTTAIHDCLEGSVRQGYAEPQRKTGVIASA